MWQRLFWLISLYVLYLMLGTAIFLYLEAENERKLRLETLNSSMITEITSALEGSNFTKSEIFQALRWYHLSMSPERSLEHTSNFIVNYLRTVFFALTLVSTIGYGNVAPKTIVGQLCSIIYAFFGMPLHIVLTMFLSDQYKECMNKLINFSKRCWPESKLAIRLMKLMAIGLAIFVFLLVPAIVFIYTERWTFLEGFYYSFITLATVGLGDYVAGNSLLGSPFYWTYLLLLLIWVIFGLAFLSVVFGWLYDHFQKLLFAVSRSCNDLDTVNATPISEFRNDSSGASVSAYAFDSMEVKNVMSLTEEDEVTEEHIRLIENMIEHFERKYSSKITGMEAKRNRLLAERMQHQQQESEN